MKAFPGLLLLPLLAVSACHKDDRGSVPVRPETAGAFLPGYPGSYWIYESYLVDSNGAGNPGSYFGNAAAIDSVYVITDTAIAGRAFHRLRKPDAPGSMDYETLYYRDSMMYLFGLKGEILFAPEDTNRIYSSTPVPGGTATSDSVIWQYRYSGDSRRMEVPFGSFLTTAAVLDWNFYPHVSGQRPVTRRRQYMRFARGIGVVSETLPFYASYPLYVERRLTRSHLVIPVE